MGGQEACLLSNLPCKKAQGDCLLGADSHRSGGPKGAITMFNSMRTSVLGFVSLLVLLPAVSMAAPKPAPKAASKNNDATIGSTLGGGTTLPAAIRGHLSLFGMLDTADQFEVSGSPKVESERTFLVGANYEFDQFNPGLALQVGGSYDFAREVKNANGLKVSEWVGYGEVTAKVSPKFKLMGGMNFNFPSFSNAPVGASIKGKLGFQFGASFQFTPQVAFDARWRQLEMEIAGDNGQGGKTTSGVKISGAMLGARYLF